MRPARPLAFAVLALGCRPEGAPAPAPAPSPPSGPRIELISERSEVRPGEPFELAIVLSFPAGREVFYYSEAAPSAGPRVVIRLSGWDEPFHPPVWGDVRRVEEPGAPPRWVLDGEGVALTKAAAATLSRPGDVLRIDVDATWHLDSEPGRARAGCELPIVAPESEHPAIVDPRLPRLRSVWPTALEEPWHVQDTRLGSFVHEYEIEVPDAIDLEFVPMPEPPSDATSSSLRLHYLDARSAFLDARGDRSGRLYVRFRSGPGRSWHAQGVVRARLPSGTEQRWFGHGWTTTH